MVVHDAERANAQGVQRLAERDAYDIVLHAKGLQSRFEDRSKDGILGTKGASWREGRRRDEGKVDAAADAIGGFGQVRCSLRPIASVNHVIAADLHRLAKQNVDAADLKARLRAEVGDGVVAED